MKNIIRRLFVVVLFVSVMLLNMIIVVLLHVLSPVCYIFHGDGEVWADSYMRNIEYKLLDLIP